MEGSLTLIHLKSWLSHGSSIPGRFYIAISVVSQERGSRESDSTATMLNAQILAHCVAEVQFYQDGRESERHVFESGHTTRNFLSLLQTSEP